MPADFSNYAILEPLLYSMPPKSARSLLDVIDKSKEVAAEKRVPSFIDEKLLHCHDPHFRSLCILHAASQEGLIDTEDLRKFFQFQHSETLKNGSELEEIAQVYIDATLPIEFLQNFDASKIPANVASAIFNVMLLHDTEIQTLNQIKKLENLTRQEICIVAAVDDNLLSSLSHLFRWEVYREHKINVLREDAKTQRNT